MIDVHQIFSGMKLADRNRLRPETLRHFLQLSDTILAIDQLNAQILVL